MPVLLDRVHQARCRPPQHILIFHEALVAQWQNQEYRNKEGYENFIELLEEVEVPGAADTQDYRFS